MEASYLRLILLTIGGLILLILLCDIWRRKQRIRDSASSSELPKVAEVETSNTAFETSANVRQQRDVSASSVYDPGAYVEVYEEISTDTTPLVSRAVGFGKNSIKQEPQLSQTWPDPLFDELATTKKSEELPINPLVIPTAKPSFNEEISSQASELLDEQESEFAENLIVINILPQPGRRFVGYELLQGILSAGLRFGYMNLFHRHKDSHGQGSILFSLATVNAPGTFDMNTIGGLSCNGLSLFMQLPTEQDSLTIFDLMLNTARCLAEDLNGELWYGHQKPLAKQHIEYYKKRILTFNHTVNH